MSPPSSVSSAPARPSDYFTLVEAFRLKVEVEEIAPLIASVMKRLELEGVAELVSMQFYTSEIPGEMGAVIRFSDRTRLRAHLAMISSWEEFARFAAMIELTEMRIFGVLDDPEIEAWMRSFHGPIKKLPNHLAGFVRA